MARPLSASRLIALVAVAAVGWIALQRRPPTAEGADRGAIERIFDGRNAGGKRVAGFSLNGGSGSQVCSDTDGYLPYFWGSYIGGDGFTGSLLSPWMHVATPVWYVPVLGYPASEGEYLAVEVRSGGNTSVIRFEGRNPGETAAFWEVDVGRWLGGEARVVCEDRLKTPRGWLGVGAPIAAANFGIPSSHFTARGTDYIRFSLAALAVAILVLLPGLVARVRTAYLPIPGILLMAGLGVALGLTKAGSSGVARDTILALYGGLGLLLALRHRPAVDSGQKGSAGWPLFTMGALAVGSLVYSVLPWPVDQEWARGTTFQGRMVASPPDHIIPYSTASYFHAGYDGREHADDYFGGNSVATRGPLVPYCLNTLFTLFRVEPKHPPDSTADAWPAAADGFYLARIIGVLTNACVVLGVMALASALGASSPAFAVGWAALAPVCWINTPYLWPKLLAAYFILLAAADLTTNKKALRAGLLSALAYLAHPVGGLFCIPLVFLAWRRGSTRITAPSETDSLPLPPIAVHEDGKRRSDIAPESVAETERPPTSPDPEARIEPLPATWPRTDERREDTGTSIPQKKSEPGDWVRIGWRHAAVYCLGIIAPLLPWLAFKASLGHPDGFWTYPLGDGQGLARAVSAASWLHARALNAWYTFVPGAFTLGHPVSRWLWGPLSSMSLWALQSAKTLPGNLAWSGFLLSCLAFARWKALSRSQRDFAACFLLPACIVILVYWGYSADGLGRNCLEPLSVALIAWTAASRRSSSWWLAAIAAESAATLLCGFLAAP